jgi:hypothetical protein
VASPPGIRPAFENQLNQHSRADLTTVASQLIVLIDEKEQTEQLALQVANLRAFIDGSDQQPTVVVFQSVLPFINTLRREEAPEGSIFLYGIWNQLFSEAHFEDRSYHAVTHPGSTSRIRIGRIHGGRSGTHAPRKVELDSEDAADCLSLIAGAFAWIFKVFRD